MDGIEKLVSNNVTFFSKGGKHNFHWKNEKTLLSPDFVNRVCSKEENTRKICYKNNLLLSPGFTSFLPKRSIIPIPS